MSFLLLKFLSLFALAALLGLMLGRWMTRRSFEDVTESYAAMSRKANDVPWQRLAARIDGLGTTVDETVKREIARIPKPDMPKVDLGGIETWIGHVDQKLADMPAPKTVDIEPMNQRLAEIDRTLKNLPKPEAAKPVDLKPIDQRIASLEQAIKAIPKPEAAKPVDLKPIDQRIASLEQAIKAIPKPEAAKPIDLKPIDQRIASLEQSIKAIPKPEAAKTVDLNPVNQRIASLEQAIKAIPKPEAAKPVDLNPVNQRIASLEQAIRNQPRPEPAKTIDLEPVARRLDAVERSLSAVGKPASINLSPLNERVASVERAVRQIRVPEAKAIDMEPVNRRLTAMDNVIRGLRSTPSTPSYEHRFDRIERQLASIGQARPAATPRTRSTRKVAASTAKRKTATRRKKRTAVRKRKTTTSARPRKKTVRKKATVRRATSGPRLLKGASYGRKDDLQRISGVGPKLERLLNRTGVYYFWQVADWTGADVKAVDEKLEGFNGRIRRDNWVRQAKKLRREPTAAKAPRHKAATA